MKKNNDKQNCTETGEKPQKKTFPVERARKLRFLGCKKELLKGKVESPLLDEIGRRLGLDQRLAAVYLALFAMALDHGGYVSTNDTAERFGLKESKRLSFLADCEKLRQAGLALARGKAGRSLVLGPAMELDTIAFAEVLHGEDSDAHVDFSEPLAVVEEAEELLGLASDREISQPVLFSHLVRLVNKSAGRNVLGTWLRGLPAVEIAIFFRAAEATIRQRLKELEDLFDDCRLSLADRGQMQRLVDLHKTNVERRRLVKFLKSDRDGCISLKLGEKATEKVFSRQRPSDLDAGEDGSRITKLLPRPENRREIFLASELTAELASLENACSPTGFRRFQRGLKKAGLPSGLTVLMHGAPGTGKTAAAFNLAHAAGRPLLQVDMSQVRDKYVGESEKHVKAVFDQWRGACNAKGPAPLLLLNEADAMVGRRVAVGHSVDQMHNIMQNVLLEELEHFDGILIATTNMIDNIDNAFDRRFLYKLRFDPPGIEERRLIWKNRMPSLPAEWLSRLSSFPLSGAQIENVARRTLLAELLKKCPDLDKLEAMVIDEGSFRDEKKQIRIKGFASIENSQKYRDM